MLRSETKTPLQAPPDIKICTIKCATCFISLVKHNEMPITKCSECFASDPMYFDLLVDRLGALEVVDNDTRNKLVSFRFFRPDLPKYDFEYIITLQNNEDGNPEIIAIEQYCPTIWSNITMPFFFQN